MFRFFLFGLLLHSLIPLQLRVASSICELSWSYGLSVKNNHTKSRRKLTPSLLIRKLSALAPPPTHHKFRKIRSFVYQKVRTSASEEPLLSAKCPHGQPPLLWLRTSFMDSPLYILKQNNFSSVVILPSKTQPQYMKDFYWQMKQHG